jgi:hypothetical protein
MPIEKRDVTLQSGETFAAAWLFLPSAEAGAKVPAVAMGWFVEHLGRPAAPDAAASQ